MIAWFVSRSSISRLLLITCVVMVVTGRSSAHYEGGFSDGGYHGQGKLISSDRKVYVGDFVNGLKQGLGSQTHPNGDRYVGEWQAICW